jgi:hypothetical protein
VANSGSLDESGRCSSHLNAGIAIVAADDEHEVRAIAEGDPTITSRMCTFEILAMPSAAAR